MIFFFLPGNSTLFALEIVYLNTIKISASKSREGPGSQVTYLLGKWQIFPRARDYEHMVNVFKDGGFLNVNQVIS